jgi:hypothetical protein
MTPRKKDDKPMTADELEQAFERIEQVFDQKVEQERERGNDDRADNLPGQRRAEGQTVNPF